MKNKVKFKKYLIKSTFVSIVLLVLFILINIYEYKVYTINFNKKINDITSYVLTKYPNLSEDEVMTIINSTSTNKNILKKYSFDIEKDSIVLKNNIMFHKFLLLNVIFLLVSFIILYIIFIKNKMSIYRDINDITRLIEEINKRNYELNIDSISEDELSILKNEIYKTTIMLKESADNSKQDKLNLKRSLEDISHQLKTPLTSILIMIDNLIDDSEMNPDMRNEFISDIKRNVININFLVQSILKLSRFDSNTINFIKNNYKLKEIVEQSIKNVSTLSDLKNVEIISEGNDKTEIYCDAKWQIEAITNILKNSIEHSKENNKVIIKYTENKTYSIIEITDFGEGISESELPHIFERFYKGKNSTSDSIGIGLALSKAIISEDNGKINVTSSERKTTFKIKYSRI